MTNNSKPSNSTFSENKKTFEIVNSANEETKQQNKELVGFPFCTTGVGIN